MKFATAISCISLLAFKESQCEKFADWIKAQHGTDLSISASLAEKYNGLDRLAEEMRDLKLFLPTDDAWAVHPTWVDHFSLDEDLRNDMFLASGAEVESGDEEPIDALRTHQRLHGTLDSGYGSSYLLSQDDVLCVGVWDYEAGDYVAADRCAELGAPITLEDAVVFKVDTVLLPDDIVDFVGGMR